MSGMNNQKKAGEALRKRNLALVTDARAKYGSDFLNLPLGSIITNSKLDPDDIACQVLAWRANQWLLSTPAEQLDLMGAATHVKNTKRLLSQQLEACDRDLQSIEAEIYNHRDPISWSHGFSMIPNQLILDIALTDHEFRIWCALWRYTILYSDKVWPSEARLAKDTGRSIRSVQRSLRALVRKNLIFIKIRTVKGNRTMNCYSFNIEKLERRYHQ